MDTNRFKKRTEYGRATAARPVTPAIPVRPAALPSTPLVSSASARPAAPDSSRPLRPQEPAVKPTPAEPQIISIQISLPKLNPAQLTKLVKPLQKPAVRLLTSTRGRLVSLPRIYYRRLARAAAVLAVLMLVGGVGLKVKEFREHRAATAAGRAVLAEAKARRAAPSFTPLAPAKDPAKQAANGTSQTAYDGTRDTYSFTDTVNGNPIVVSQQPIPAKFKDAKAAVNQIAPTIKAQESVLTDAGLAYIATDPKANSQTVVFGKDNLLVFIQSPFTHPSSEWKAYINTLKAQ